MTIFLVPVMQAGGWFIALYDPKAYDSRSIIKLLENFRFSWINGIFSMNLIIKRKIFCVTTILSCFCTLILKGDVYSSPSVKCKQDGRGNEHCSKDSDDEEACFYEEAEETLFQWNPVEKGYTREVELESGRKYNMKTIAVKPKLFEIPNFLSDEECNHIIEKAGSFGLSSSGLFFDKFALASKNYTHGHSKLISGNFQKWDKDEDGVISINDIKKFAISTRFLYLDDDDVIKMFEDMHLIGFDDRQITKEEFESFNTDAVNEYMKALRETHPRFRDRFSDQTWLRQDSSADGILRKLRKRVQRLTKLPKRIIDGGEPLQVLHYDIHGHYHAHFDGQSKEQFHDLECCQFMPAAMSTECRLCRFITILYYLNDVEEGGETAFPVADDENYEHSDFATRKEGDFYNLSKFCHNSTAVVKPEKGKAVMWYNHDIDEHGWLGERDDYSLHGGCDIIKGEKWVANNWIPAPDFVSRHKLSLYTRE